ncbi:hypothetical protein HYE67_005564 [Fusarium culmorum]|uniref:Uncharacterized protein n=1 Tax=Fusarium culmorum TaxID=5516 RepID=A0A7S8D7L5_FUSCU|nr:hypothetical protein HYE67_005564 [Fusarium culmorum]
MTSKDDLMERVLEAIQSSNLRHPDNRFFECFLEDSVDPNASAQYVFDKCPANEGLLDFEAFLYDWKNCRSNGERIVGAWQLQSPDKEIVSKVKVKDGDECMITGLQSSFFDPLIVAPIPRIQNSLSKPDGLQKYMLVRRSAAIAFSQGHFKFKFSNDPNYHVWHVWIGGPDRPSI